MKYIVMLGDGMSDYPVPELGGKTPLEAANKPNMDYLAAHGVVGMAKTVPDGYTPGSDVANISVIGYNPADCYSGRSPLEAVSMGIDLADDDVTFRCNLVTLSDAENYEDAIMLDNAADEISTPEAAELMNYVNTNLRTDDFCFYPGVSYRHCAVMSHAETGSDLTPPHDILDKPIKTYLPGGKYGERLLGFMKRSWELLRDHPINKARIERGLRPANSCWFWGEGTRPSLNNFEEIYGKKGGMVSAVDLLKGIGICIGFKNAEVEGATGNIDTNFKGKADAALEMLHSGCDIVYIHVEAPDESGHRGELDNKIRSIELIDSEILGPVMNQLRKEEEDFSVLLMPDHPTPTALRTHVSDPVPFVLYRSDKEGALPAAGYSEKQAEATGLYLPEAHKIMSRFLSGEFI
ncbi:MAG: cofactor-independent phosphoglycerate mutase [Ruminococcaceae bacterium]|nr:cofactor-independent phosphoglycerate mutase [Oscillospiraceae bacterium]